MDPTDRDASHVWLSYAEAAEALGISARAVEGRAYRAGWERQKANDKTVRLAVPREALDPTKHKVTATDNPMHGPMVNDLLAEVKVAHEENVGILRQRLETTEADLVAERARFAEARERAARLEGQAAELQAAQDREREAAMAERSRADRAEGELEGLKLGTEHQHAELAQMRREMAEAHNRAVVAEQQVIEATRQREGAEVALAKVRKWSFLDFLFGREGKGRS